MELEAAAKEHKVEGMQRAFDGINASCIGCHSRFRDFAGQLDFGRAAAPPQKAMGVGGAAALRRMSGGIVAHGVLFLCTGNYYRSRFAEILFNHAAQSGG